METLATIAELRELLKPLRLAGKTIAVVPTMGALHAGHVSLIERARNECDCVVMTLFVNPTQFNDPKDFEKYPRDVDRDSKLAADAGVDFIFAPSPDEMYPDGFQTKVSVTELASSLEGKHRPGHFDGVCVVVAKLLNIVQADRAYFGMKDFQQLQIVKRLVSDLNIPTEIVSCPTLRESDGLAMSSRNVRLTPEQRSAATVLYKALSAGRKMVIDDKVTDPPIILHYMRTIINTEPLALLEYAEVVDQETLKPVNYINGECAPIALLAARFGDIRLIDNMILSSDSS